MHSQKTTIPFAGRGKKGGKKLIFILKGRCEETKSRAA